MTTSARGQGLGEHVASIDTYLIPLLGHIEHCSGPAYHASNPRLPRGAMEGMAPILHVADARASSEWYARGMREARLTDPDGNLVRVGSPLREPKPADLA